VILIVTFAFKNINDGGEHPVGGQAEAQVLMGEIFSPNTIMEGGAAGNSVNKG